MDKPPNNYHDLWQLYARTIARARTAVKPRSPLLLGYTPAYINLKPRAHDWAVERAVQLLVYRT